jgi:cytochrome c553
MTAPGYEPAELFYIVKHGVKFTGMPAWPAPTRDDEVWAMVAFLRRLPGLEPEAYRQLVPRQGRLDAAAMPLEDLSGPTAALSPLVERCAVCHGADGLGRGAGAFPRIAGQRRQYLLNALQAYARGDRHSGLMQPVAQGLRPAETALLADYFSRLPSGHVAAAGPHASAAADPAAVERGARIAQRGIPERGVPACLECHGPRSGPINPAYPLLDGQYRAYLELQLRLFRADQRGGSPFAHLMRRVAATLPPESIPDVAAYYAARQAGID